MSRPIEHLEINMLSDLVEPQEYARHKGGSDRSIIAPLGLNALLRYNSAYKPPQTDIKSSKKGGI